MADQRVVTEGLRLLPGLEQVKGRLGSEPESVLEGAFPEADAGLRSPAIIPDLEGTARSGPSGVLATAIDQERERLVHAGERAIVKLEEDGENARLSDDESDGLEAIINLTVRPAIRIIKGEFLQPTPPWEDLEQFRAAIQSTAGSVGRVEVSGNPLLPFAGTGSMVADGVVMTNRHVAKVFASREGENWVFEPDITAGLAWADDPDSEGDNPFTVKGVIGVHPQFDLALLEVEPPDGAVAPPPVTIASEAMEGLDGRRVFTLGYPAFDPRNGAEAMRRIFGDVYNVKRLQPGEIMAVRPDAGLFHHDCSTLGGNSGSCVVDLESNLVLGLHFSGSYLKSNRAVALWQLADDPMLTKAGVNFA